MFHYFRNYSSNAIMFAVKGVRLKVYKTITSPMTLLFTQGHKCASNLTFCEVVVYIAISRTVSKLGHSSLAWRQTYAWHIITIPMLISMTLTLLQGHSGSAKAKKHHR